MKECKKKNEKNKRNDTNDKTCIIEVTQKADDTRGLKWTALLAGQEDQK